MNENPRLRRYVAFGAAKHHKCAHRGAHAVRRQRRTLVFAVSRRNLLRTADRRRDVHSAEQAAERHGATDRTSAGIEHDCRASGSRLAANSTNRRGVFGWIARLLKSTRGTCRRICPRALPASIQMSWFVRSWAETPAAGPGSRDPSPVAARKPAAQQRWSWRRTARTRRETIEPWRIPEVAFSCYSNLALRNLKIWDRV